MWPARYAHSDGRRPKAATSPAESSGRIPWNPSARWSRPGFHTGWWPRTTTGWSERRGELVEPLELVGVHEPPGVAGARGVQEREGDPVEHARLPGPRGEGLPAEAVVVAPHVHEAVAERAAPELEEPLVVRVEAVVGQVALDDDRVGREARGVCDDRGAHHLGVRRLALGAAEHLEGRAALDVPADGLADVHVVGRGEGAADLAEVAHRAELDAVLGELGVGREAVEPHDAAVDEQLRCVRGDRHELRHASECTATAA